MFVDSAANEAARLECEPPAMEAGETKPSHNFTIPKIVITRAPERPRYSEPIPEQTYDKAVLFVPVKTEELSWDAGGLYWNGTYAYPVHTIYSREGDSIGRRRNGPPGYRFSEMFESRPPAPASVGNVACPAGENKCASQLGDAPEGSCAASSEEAEVILEEPAPTPLAPSDASDEVEVVDSPPPSPLPDCSTHEDDCADDGSLCGESETLSIFSRRDSADSAATTPGHSTPPACAMDVDCEGVKPDLSLDTSLLCQKLEAESTRDEAATSTAEDVTLTASRDEAEQRGQQQSMPSSSSARGRQLSQGWTHLGFIPRRGGPSDFAKQRACTLPDSGKDRFGFSKSLKLDTALDISKKHRSVSMPSSPILDETEPPAPTLESPPTSPTLLSRPPLGDAPEPFQAQHPRSRSDGTSSRRRNSSTIFSSIASDLTHSAFPAQAKGTATGPARRSSLSAKPSLRRKHRYDEFAIDADYSAGWAFEQGASSLRNEWQMS
ncbi:uncharacterized protein PFL1_06462 [Pseudozyma flocculosa PF-1]|uniref:Uncharacterized protein n=2 Tax=Pseudozyma flocculosa TaxID=84751 RepID=A0A5C3EW53_9BASI|nr:uncharacterized protein PFL1_06462 [Pseudozyma flocculosa PF-1]EPQ26008.1 hypothetical protein PFL1_06462 [Pseudozyma flocculosa PF-1]SPO35687.1 uncharacterized protein PSFLO_01158 [Pseudozyma flocculosa]